MAAPHVTGVSALLKAQDGARDWRVIKNLILSGGDRVAGLEDRTISGSRLSALGALTCVERPLLARLRPVGLVLRGSVGTPIGLAALHVNCGNPNGDVLVNVFPGNGIIRLLDDGASPDQAAGDGIYSGQWTPSAEGLYLLEYPGGDVVAVAVGAVASSYVPHFDQGEEWWTGLTLANPGGSAADVVVEARDTAGRVLGARVLTVPAGAQAPPRLLSDLLGVRGTGWLRVTASAPLVGSLFIGRWLDGALDALAGGAT